MTSAGASGQRLERIVVYADGASRGNPGPAAAAWVICTPEGDILESSATYIGSATNNTAEYSAVSLGLKKATSFCTWQATVRTDCELLVRQMNHQYRIKNDNLRDLAERIRSTEHLYRDRVSYEHRPRSNPMIMRADNLANDCLDSQG